MSGHTAWGVGGVADRVYQPADVEDLGEFLACLGPRDSVLWVGLGSNLLVRDGGVEEVVILTSRGLGAIEQCDAHTARAEAGVPCAKLARYCAGRGLSGGEFFAGIPGTVGGALAMNAGAFDAETWALVRRVETVNRHGARRWRDRCEFEVGYRTVRGPGEEWFTCGSPPMRPPRSEPAPGSSSGPAPARSRRDCGAVAPSFAIPRVTTRDGSSTSAD